MAMSNFNGFCDGSEAQPEKQSRPFFSPPQVAPTTNSPFSNSQVFRHSLESLNPSPIPFLLLRKLTQLASLFCVSPSNFYPRNWANTKRSLKNQFRAIALVSLLSIQSWVHFCTFYALFDCRKNFGKDLKPKSRLYYAFGSNWFIPMFEQFYIPLFDHRPRN